MGILHAPTGGDMLDGQTKGGLLNRPKIGEKLVVGYTVSGIHHLWS